MPFCCFPIRNELGEVRCDGAAWGTRRCVVLVTDERTLQERTRKREREEGKMVPVSAVMDMKVGAPGGHQLRDTAKRGDGYSGRETELESS